MDPWGHMPTKLPAPKMTQAIAWKFCEACNWAYEAWVMHKYLFDLNPDPTATIERRNVIPFFNRLSNITHEYALQQIAKLHDPAVMGKDHNLSIEFVVCFGEWGNKENDIKAIRNRLSEFWGHVSPARNKLLAHNDLETILADKSLGGFPVGEDDQYFLELQNLVNAVSERWLGCQIYPFNDLAIRDVEDFLDEIRANRN